MATLSPLPSKSAINHAGEFLVSVGKNGVAVDFDKYAEAYEILDSFRAVHQQPMTKVAMGLRSMVHTVTRADPIVSQRLKRSPRIVRKLVKMGNSSLARLEDIGGCRAVVQNLEELEAVRDRIEAQWGQRYDQIRRERDYVNGPQPTGYRALHWVVERDGRRIEVQLRTRLQQQWANAVEAADARLGMTLKDGVGPVSMLEYFQTLGDYMDTLDHHVPDEALRGLLTARESTVIAEGYYSGRGSA